MARRVATLSPRSSGQDVSFESQDLPSPREQCRAIVRNINIGNSEFGLAEFREWWAVLSRGTTTAPTLMSLIDVTTQDKVQQAIQDAIKDKRCNQSCRALKRCHFWKLSIYDVWGLFGRDGATSRTFLDKLTLFPGAFENADDALKFMRRARKQRLESSKSLHEWKPQDLTLALQLKREEDVEARNRQSTSALLAIDTESTDEEDEDFGKESTEGEDTDSDEECTEEEDNDLASQDGALGGREDTDSSALDETIAFSRASGADITPATPNNAAGGRPKRKRRLSDISQWPRSIEKGRGLRKQNRSTLPRRSSDPADDFSFWNPNNNITHQPTPASDDDANHFSQETPINDDATYFGALTPSPSDARFQPGAAPSLGVKRASAATPSLTFQLDESSEINPPGLDSTSIEGNSQTRKMSKRPRRDTNALVQDAAGLQPARWLTMSFTQPITLDHMESWIVTLSTALNSHTSLKSSTIAEFTEWMETASQTAVGRHTIVIRDEAAERIPVVSVDCSSSPTKVNVYAEDSDFALLNNAAMNRVCNVFRKPLPTIDSDNTTAEDRLGESILSACVIVGTISAQKPGLKTKLQHVVPSIWERAIRLVHEYRAGSPESQTEVLARCRIVELPNPNCVIDPATVMLPQGSTTHVDFLNHIFENTILSAFQQCKTLSEEWEFVAANSRVVAKIASEVSKSPAAPLAAPNPPPELQELQEELEDIEKDITKYQSRTAMKSVLDTLTTEAAALRSKIEELSNAMSSQESSGWTHVRELMMQLNGQIDHLTHEWSQFRANVQSEFTKWCCKAREELGCDETDSNDSALFG